MVGVGDINIDGLIDITITEFSHDQFNLLIAEKVPSGLVVFTEKAARTGFRDITFAKLGWGANLFDVDLDGDIDFFYACGHVYPEVDLPLFKDQNTPYKQTNLLLLNRDPRRLQIEDVSARAGPGLQVPKASRAAVTVDYDDDGDLDIATTELNDSPSLLRCDLDPSVERYWLAVRLRGRPMAKLVLNAILELNKRDKAVYEDWGQAIDKLLEIIGVCASTKATFVLSATCRPTRTRLPDASRRHPSYTVNSCLTRSWPSSTTSSLLAMLAPTSTG